VKIDNFAKNQAYVKFKKPTDKMRCLWTTNSNINMMGKPPSIVYKGNHFRIHVSPHDPREIINFFNIPSGTTKTDLQSIISMPVISEVYDSSICPNRLESEKYKNRTDIEKQVFESDRFRFSVRFESTKEANKMWALIRGKAVKSPDGRHFYARRFQDYGAVKFNQTKRRFIEQIPKHNPF